MNTEPVQKWEYLTAIVDVSPYKASVMVGSDKFDKTLEQLGEQGWELVSVVSANTHMGTVAVMLFFKRPKS
ncbi:MAG: DUF4177 domain-containing protein [Caldilinea sp.]